MNKVKVLRWMFIYCLVMFVSVLIAAIIATLAGGTLLVWTGLPLALSGLLGSIYALKCGRREELSELKETEGFVFTCARLRRHC